MDSHIYLFVQAPPKNIVIFVALVLLVCWVLGLREPLMAIGRWAMRVGRCVRYGKTFSLS